MFRWSAIAVALLPMLLGAQQVPRLTLAPANASLDEELSNLTWVRELKDGRLIVTDGRDGRIVLADLKSGKVEQISRKGQGPGEYPRALPVWSIGGDSSVMVDAQQRWLLFDGPRVVATLPPDAPAVAAGRGLPRGADAVGHVYTAAFLPGQGRPIGDSTALVRVSRATGKPDTLTRLRALVARGGRDSRGNFNFSMPTIAMADEPAVFADGWVAVVRTDAYRVEWRSPDGKWTRGAPLPFTTLRMNEREKRAYVDRVARANGRGAMAIDSITDWPEMVPPYRSPANFVGSPDGRLLIQRLASAEHPETRYDLVNRRGTLDGQLVMPPNERIVSFGTASVYVAVTDDDGIQRVRRHPWPPSPAR
jgi:hypothetical protein